MLYLIRPQQGSLYSLLLLFLHFVALEQVTSFSVAPPADPHAFYKKWRAIAVHQEAFRQQHGVHNATLFGDRTDRAHFDAYLGASAAHSAFNFTLVSPFS